MRDRSTNAYPFNPYRNPPAGAVHYASGDWDDTTKVGALLTSPAAHRLFSKLSGSPSTTLAINTRLTPAPSYGAPNPSFIPAANYVAVADLNITNYDDYMWADPMALKDCLSSNPIYPVGFGGDNSRPNTLDERSHIRVHFRHHKPVGLSIRRTSTAFRGAEFCSSAQRRNRHCMAPSTHCSDRRASRVLTCGDSATHRSGLY